MLRYLGMVWDSTSPQQQETAQLIAARMSQLPAAWRQEFHAPGMQVFCAGARVDSSQIHRVSDDGGVVIGSLFARNRDLHSQAQNEQLNFGPTQSKAFVQSRGQWLIDHAWGNYVAFGRDGLDETKWVLKDPTGSLPCLHSRFRGVSLFFSRIGDCLDLKLLRFTINDAFLHAHLMASSNLHELSSLKEVSPVRGGECVEFQRNGSSSSKYYWNPLSFHGADDLIEDPELAARAMRGTLKATVSTLASSHRSLLLRLSGGLDSSIIAGCLKDAPIGRFNAYTYYAPSGRSDERPWARLAAQHAGCEHIEYPLTPLDMDLSLGLRMAPSAEPLPLLGFIQRSTVEQELAARTGATGIFGGDGGDSGFCADSLSHAVPEYLRNHGPSPRLFRLASQVALVIQKSSWNVLTTAVRRTVTGEGAIPRERILEACQLVSPHIKQDYRGQTVSHPWFQGQRRVPWDKIRRLGTLTAASDYYNVAARADEEVPEIVSPLYTQPVIELLLRIPIYVHFHQGRDRGLARHAFAAEVPEPILRRLWKDRAPGFHDQVFERQRTFFTETLLEGVLVSNGLLNRPLLEEVLASRPTKNTVYPGEVFRHLDTELWARHWLQRSQQQAAA
ncbi:MAG TPA: asparagine synthase-related protein [Steroidobacter sp.]|uniref:asparagine synthase-related protein n=1 Tax=Steroidobacter sp. TaxID=1978227 RepID=UPI002ED82FF1